MPATNQQPPQSHRRQAGQAIRQFAFACTATAVLSTAQAHNPADANTATTDKKHHAVGLETVSVKADAMSGDRPAAYAGGQIAKGGGLGILGVADVMDQPFSTTNYTQQFMRDIQAQTLADVVVNNASVRTQSTAGGFQDSFQIRGFAVGAADVAYDGLYGLVSSSSMPVNLFDRIEVLQGPGALMYGVGPNASIGGAVNVQPKHADDTPLTRVSLTYQSRTHFGTQLDVGRRFGGEHQWGIRINGLFNDGQGTLAHGNRRGGNGSINLDYRGRRLRWSLDSYALTEDADEYRAQIAANAVTSIPAPPSAWRSLYPGGKFKFHDAATATRAEYDINSHVTVYGAAGAHYGMSKQSFPRTATAMDSAGDFTIRNGYYDAYNRTRTVDVGTRFHFDSFGLHHTLVAGYTSLNENIGYAYALSATANPSNLYNPKPLPEMPARTPWGRSQHNRLNSEQLIDSISMLDDRILLMGGVRNQTIAVDAYAPATGTRNSSYASSAISPLAGVVIKPLEHVSLYANFTSGLSQGPTAPVTASNASQVFAPYSSKQYEAGVKADWGHVMTSAAVFQLSQPNGVLGADNIYRLSGSTRVRGLELNSYGEVVPGLRLMASATFYDASLIGTAGKTNDGNRPAAIPDYTFNVGADWDLPWVPGLGLNGRVQHTGHEYLDAANKLQIPAWTRYDAGLRYSTTIKRRPVVFRATLQNIFAKRYWVAQSVYLMESAPRTVLLSAQIDL